MSWTISRSNTGIGSFNDHELSCITPSEGMSYFFYGEAIIELTIISHQAYAVQFFVDVSLSHTCRLVIANGT